MTTERPQAATNGAHGGTLEKDWSGHGGPHLDNSMDSGTALNRIRTAGSISISPELFEKIYLSPQNQVKGELRKTLGNPTPLGLLGFILSLTPLSNDLMGWRGAGGNGAAGTATYFFFGGLLMVLGGVGEWVLGNTFPFVVFTSFGAFWLGFAGTLQPFYNAYGAYSPDVNNPAEGLNSPVFQATFAFFLLYMGLLCLVYLICSLRTNVVFFVIFLTLVIAFGLLAGAYWQLFNNPAMGAKLTKAAGGVTFVTSLAGWYIFFAIMLAALDFPFQIPVGDLSGYIKGASDKARMAREGDV